MNFLMLKKLVSICFTFQGSDVWVNALIVGSPKRGTKFLGKVVTARSGALGSGVGEWFGGLGEESLGLTTREIWLLDRGKFALWD